MAIGPGPLPIPPDNANDEGGDLHEPQPLVAPTLCPRFFVLLPLPAEMPGPTTGRRGGTPASGSGRRGFGSGSRSPPSPVRRQRDELPWPSVDPEGTRPLSGSLKVGPTRAVGPSRGEPGRVGPTRRRRTDPGRAGRPGPAKSGRPGSAGPLRAEPGRAAPAAWPDRAEPDRAGPCVFPVSSGGSRLRLRATTILALWIGSPRRGTARTTQSTARVRACSYSCRESLPPKLGGREGPRLWFMLPGRLRLNRRLRLTLRLRLRLRPSPSTRPRAHPATHTPRPRPPPTDPAHAPTAWPTQSVGLALASPSLAVVAPSVALDLAAAARATWPVRLSTWLLLRLSTWPPLLPTWLPLRSTWLVLLSTWAPRPSTWLPLRSTWLPQLSTWLVLLST